ncbi:MAG: septum formation initiator family protein [Ruminococcaceae bacterium]|nr:septum formation initiator family protein [Oscillospiraceae bacterium]
MKKKGGSALEEKERLKNEENGERDLGRAVKKGIKTPHIKVIARLLLATLIIASIATFVTGLMKYSELQREKEALEQKVEEYEAEVEKLEYLIDCPVDYDYIVRIAKEKLNLYLPDEIIYHNDSNK